MKGFENYLKSKGYSKRTVATYLAQLHHYTHWLAGQQLEDIQASHTDMLAYLKYCSSNGNAQKTQQCRIRAVGHYYAYLKQAGAVAQNPTDTLEIKGVKRNILYHLLEPHRLNTLYHAYPVGTPVQQRNKVIVGLLVYQGLRSDELGRLTVKDVKVREGEITVPGGRKSNERKLQLESDQVLDMYEYLLQARPVLLSGWLQTSGAKATEQLFISPYGSNRFSVLMRPVIKWLKEKHQVESLHQVRASVITKWLKRYNLRQVQYLAGHRYISSTEHYLQNDMEGLQEEINQYHPLG